MDLDVLRAQARAQAKDFLENEQEYRMGYVDAEKSHPYTRRLSQTYAESAREGVKLLFGVDDQMAQRSLAALQTPEYVHFADTVRNVLKNGGRVIFSGCGSSGRLSMRLEQSWRNAIAKLSRQYPQSADALQCKLTSVGNIMTGGDYAIIRAAESFEDSTALGMAQARALSLGKGDLLVGITATGETTSILGTATQALSDGAQVCMLICSDPKPVVEKMSRARVVFTHPNCFCVSLPCGPMALTGSTRMQSSSFEQFAAAVALEGALFDILKLPFPGYAQYGKAFQEMTEQLLSERCVDLIANATLQEQAVYEAGGLITLFADEYLMDVLTDTTERAPTFMTPPFCSADMVDQEPSWAFVKNPTCSTEEAWEKCFLRQPNCIDWEPAFYASLGLNEQQIAKIPDLSLKALKRFIIGNEPAPDRENAPRSFALWVDAKPAPACFRNHADRYTGCGELTLTGAGIALMETGMDMFEHLAVKMMLNTLSTGVMARMGRVAGNWMVSLAMSNKKLADRSARIVADVCGVPYEQALEEVFYAKSVTEAQGLNRSPAQEAIRALGMK